MCYKSFLNRARPLCSDISALDIVSQCYALLSPETACAFFAFSLGCSSPQKLKTTLKFSISHLGKEPEKSFLLPSFSLLSLTADLSARSSAILADRHCVRLVWWRFSTRRLLSQYSESVSKYPQAVSISSSPDLHSSLGHHTSAHSAEVGIVPRCGCTSLISQFIAAPLNCWLW